MVDVTTECKTTMDFHPCDTPRGMNYYNLKDLDALQQTILNQHKLQIVRENHTYLRNHPEVRVVVKLVLGEVLKSRPLRNIPEFISSYFVKNSEEIQEKMIAAVEKHSKEREEEQRELSEMDSGTSSFFSRHTAHGEQIDLDQVAMDYLAYQAAGEAEKECEHFDRSEDAMLICYEIVEELVQNVSKREIPSSDALPYTDSDPMLDIPYTMENFDETYLTSIS